MKTQEQLINNLIGQLKGIKKMLQIDKNCDLTLIQLKAIKSALNAFINKYIEKNVLKCLEKKCSQKNNQKLKNLIEYLVKNN